MKPLRLALICASSTRYCRSLASSFWIRFNLSPCQMPLAPTSCRALLHQAVLALSWVHALDSYGWGCQSFPGYWQTVPGRPCNTSSQVISEV